MSDVNVLGLVVILWSSGGAALALGGRWQRGSLARSMDRDPDATEVRDRAASTAWFLVTLGALFVPSLVWVLAHHARQPFVISGLLLFSVAIVAAIRIASPPAELTPGNVARFRAGVALETLGWWAFFLGAGAVVL
jgi:hypothetical protein